MTLRLFGAGGAFSRRYGTTCSMVTLRSGERWLIDCGRQAPDQLHAAGVVWHDITGQIVTHVHGDHVYGLEDFAFLRYFESRGSDLATSLGGTMPKLVAHSAVRAEVWETLAPSLRYLNDGRGNLQSGTLGHYFDIVQARDVEPPRHNPWNHSEHFAVDALDVVARESMHVPGKPSCSLEFRIDPGSERIAWWSGDCTVDREFLMSIEPRTSVFFHDCTFVDYTGQVHGFFEKLEALPERVRRKMVLMHHEDNLELNRPRVEAAGFRIAMPGQIFDLVSGARLS
jgi:ribonuclease BN (tRNA processing enzyme)